MKIHRVARRSCSAAFAVSLLVSAGCTGSSDNAVPPTGIPASVPAGPTGTHTTAAPFPAAATSTAAPSTAVSQSVAPAAPAKGDVGTLSAAGQAVVDQPRYAGTSWAYHVTDLETGEVLLSHASTKRVFTASTGKFFTVGSVFAQLGPSTTLSTPVYTTGRLTGHTLDGDLVLVASGDLALGGRGALEGRMDQTFSDTTIDHVYGDIAPNASLTPENPLAGLDSLAQQVKAAGITSVKGDVLIDDRLWDTFASAEGPVPPIFVNDNIFDITVTGGEVDTPATVVGHPATRAFTVTSTVTTGPLDSVGNLGVDVDPADPRHLTVSGTVPAGKSQVTIYRVPDASDWARTLFIEALQRAGIDVTATPSHGNDVAALPEPGSYSDTASVAELTSPTLSTMAAMIMLTSYNKGANTMMCLLAVKAGSTDCLAGLKLMHAAAAEAGLSPAQTLLFDGQGADPEVSTPAELVKYLTWASTQPWGRTLEDGLPVFGVSGSLARYGLTSPAKGRIVAKTGTSAHQDPVTGTVLFHTLTYAGYMTTASGRELAFHLSLNGATFPDVPSGLKDSGEDLAAVAEAIWQQIP